MIEPQTPPGGLLHGAHVGLDAWSREDFLIREETAIAPALIIGLNGRMVWGSSSIALNASPLRWLVAALVLGVDVVVSMANL